MKLKQQSILYIMLFCYSRQNLLSNNSCKSNDGLCSISQNVNIDRLTLRNNQHQPSTMTYNNLPNQFRNQFNQLNISTGQNHDVGININHNTSQQQQQQHHTTEEGNDSLNENLVTNNFNNISNLDSSINLCGDGGGDDGSTNTSYMSSILQFHTNPINLGVYEFNTKSKTKGNDNKKHLRHQLRPFDLNNLYNQESNQNIDVDLNLANRRVQNQPNNNNNMKPTSKMFEALKENVYLEVSALIAANETRPHFLIQLFRDLQLISSDPLRQRTLQSIQDLYSRYIETIVQEEQPGNHQTISTASQAVNIENITAQNQNFNILDVPQNLPLVQSTISTAPTQTNHDIIKAILHDISKYLQKIDNINDNSLHKINSITLTHLSNPNNNTNNKMNLNLDEIMKNLNNFNRFDKDEFLLNVEYYLNSVVLKNETSTSYSTSGSSVKIDKIDDYFSNGKNNEMRFVLVDIYDNNPNACNEDLAEADQICSNENSLINHLDGDDGGFGEGAVGGNAETVLDFDKIPSMMSSTIKKEVENTDTSENNSKSEENVVYDNECSSATSNVDQLKSSKQI